MFKTDIILISQQLNEEKQMAKVTKNKKEDPEVVESTKDNTETFSRIFYTILLTLIGWVTLWVFAFVVIIQFGFLLITGKVNSNLKGFNKEVGLYLFDIIKYLSFQSNVKPFPFRDWPYDESSINQNNSELNDSAVVKASK